MFLLFRKSPNLNFILQTQTLTSSFLQSQTIRVNKASVSDEVIFVEPLAREDPVNDQVEPSHIAHDLSAYQCAHLQNWLMRCGICPCTIEINL